jgi:putative ABC transport system permease protein
MEAWMGTLVQDVRYSWRMLAAHRGFSAVAILTLALGIGASTALFSVIDAAILHPLPYDHPEQLVHLLVEERVKGEVSAYSPSLTEARGWQHERGALAHVCVSRSSRPPILVDTGEFERVAYMDLTEGCLDMYGAAPVIGRDITIEDTRIGAPRVVLLGYRYWQTRFGGSRDAIGRDLRLPDGLATIVGVVPARFGRDTGLFRALQFTTADMEGRRGTGTSTYARLRPGVTPAQAAAALAGASTVQVQSLHERTTRGYAYTLRTLVAAVVIILLLACVNVAGLLLARGTARQTELAVRASIGATRASLVRQLLTESLLLAALAGVIGVYLAWVSLDALIAILPLALPADAPAALNMTVLAFAASAAVVSALMFGLVPALRLSGRAGTAALARGGRGRASPLSRRNGQALIAAEVAMALVLLAAAGVMVRSFARLVSEDLGFDAENVYSMEVVPADRQPEALATYYPELVAPRTRDGARRARRRCRSPAVDRRRHELDRRGRQRVVEAGGALAGPSRLLRSTGHPVARRTPACRAGRSPLSACRGDQSGRRHGALRQRTGHWPSHPVRPGEILRGNRHRRPGEQLGRGVASAWAQGVRARWR